MKRVAPIIALFLLLASPTPVASAAAPVCTTPPAMTAASGATLHVFGFYACDDSDGDALTYAVVTAPVHGSVAITGADLAYRSDAGYLGADSFGFKANDGTTDSNTVTVTITVGPNQPPSCPGDLFFDAEPGQDTSFDPGGFFSLCSDPEYEQLTFEVVAPPAHGTLSAYLAGVGFTYHPAAGYSGPDAFTFEAHDGVGVSESSTVHITVLKPNPSALRDPADAAGPPRRIATAGQPPGL